MSVSPKHISLFTGAGGLDIGLERAGFETRVAVERDRYCRETLGANRSSFRDPDFVVLNDITQITPADVLEKAGLSPGEATLLSGGPPCQTFSTAGKRASIVDPRGHLFLYFAETVGFARPRFFIMENVRGLLSAAIRHRPLHLRNGHGPLEDEEMLGSVFNQIILPTLEQQLGYQVSYGLLNSLDYGAAQDRKRLIIIGSRDHELGGGLGRTPIESIAPPTHGRQATNGKRTWRTLRDGLHELDDPQPEFQRYSPARAEVLNNVPPGKNWRYFRDSPEFGPEYVKAVLGGAYGADGGRVGFWRRLSWDKWSPTLTTSPCQKSTSLCHPDETRPLSVKEYSRLQGFPDYWDFRGPTAARYRQIGNAVSGQVANALGEAIMAFVSSRVDVRPVRLAVQT